MKEKIFAIIGKPLSHSLSPLMHSYWYKKYSINAKYEPIEIEQNEIKDVIANSKDIIFLTGSYRDFFGKLFRANKIKFL